MITKIKFFLLKNIHNIFFYTRINLFLFVSSFLKNPSNHQKLLRKIVTGIKNDGYCKIENFFDECTIDNISTEINKNLSKYYLDDNGYPISNDQFLKKNDPKNNKHQIKSGELKLMIFEHFSKEMNFLSRNSFFQMINIILKGNLRYATLQYHVVTNSEKNFQLVSGKSTERISGTWHSDNKVKHVIKGIIYLDDVNIETGGYTEMIKNSKKRLMNKDFRTVTQFTDENRLLSDDDLKNMGFLYNPDDKIKLLGKKGDLIYLDSSNLHRGTQLNNSFRRLLWIY